MPSPRVCIIGTGNIAQTHAEVIDSIGSVEKTAVVDIDQNRSEAFAKQWGFEQVFPDLESAIAENAFDVAHITTPPDSHADILCTLAKANLGALVEKPVCTSEAELDRVTTAVNQSDAHVGVNQNFVHHPAFQRLLDVLESNDVGAVKQVSCHYFMPLRQLDAQQFGHWMFQHPVNLLLEQAVHPLSQISAITGPLSVSTVSGARGDDLVQGVPFYSSIQVSMKGPKADAYLGFSLGHANATWQIKAICEDGNVTADIIANRCTVQRPGPRLEFIDAVLQSLKQSFSIFRQGVKGGLDYLTALLKLSGRRDSFFLSMRGSISAYYESLNNKTNPQLDVEFGGNLVSVCERICLDLEPDFTPSPSREVDSNASGCDVIVLGGSGFIGLHTVRQLKNEGHKVALMARSVDHLLRLTELSDVKILRGNVSRQDDLDRAIRDVPIVINCAHGGGGDSWEAIQRALVGSARLVAERCLTHKSKRLIHVGSIAGLYLGNPNESVTGSTPPDPEAVHRADYARAKAEADNLLLQMAKEQGLPVTIVRPGVVVGIGGSPFHSAVGFANTETHWFGWNAGVNPLPFVLVDDVADAIVRAAVKDGIEGRCFNLASDLELGAREYLSKVADRLGRPVQFHPTNIYRIWLEEIGKWLVKIAIGRRVAMPRIREFKSRAMLARLDCTDTRESLGWTPEQDVSSFFDRVVPRSGTDDS